MKRINSYFSPLPKKVKGGEIVSSNVPTPNPPINVQSQSTEIAAELNKSTNDDIISDYPDCWNMDQKIEFCLKYDWLITENKKLGCSICRGIGALGIEQNVGMKISKEWTTITVIPNGETRQRQLSSLRKKIYEHKESASHKAIIKIQNESKKKILENVCFKAISHQTDTTEKIFRTAYKIAKKNQAFNDFETEIDLQELNGIDMGHILHSTNACINIIKHISKEMKTAIVANIIEKDLKFALLVDESTTLSQSSTLIIYFRVFIPNNENIDVTRKPVNLFINLIELTDVTATGIFNSLIENLCLIGFTQDYLKKNLVAFACDGAAVMLGRRSGVSTLLKNMFPSILIWHCANHRLELSVADAVKSVSSINRFKSFMDKLYVIYHASPKNSRELSICATELEVQILKIGRILSTRWVASSFRSVYAVWENYEVLVKHFTKAQSDNQRDTKDRSMYSGLLLKITSSGFILDLALMCDALQELSELSLELQSRNINLYTAHQKIKLQTQFFEERITSPGTYYKIAVSAVDSLKFKNVSINKTNKFGRYETETISPSAFYKHLKQSIEKRLLSAEDIELPQYSKVLYPENWPNDIHKNITYGETEIQILSKRFGLNERQITRGFREYLEEKQIPSSLLPLVNILDVVPISTSECERGFSQMNLIITPTRSSLLTSTAASLLFIRMVGPPLRIFNPQKYVKSWLIRGHHSATDTNSKKRNREKDYDENMAIIWKNL